MKKYITALFSLYFLFLFSCYEKKSHFLKIVESDFIDTALTDMSDEFPQDSLNIEIGLGFKNDYVCLYINNIQMVCDTLSTDKRIDIAGSYNFGHLKDIKTIGIKINNCSQEIIELKGNYRFLDFDINKDTLIATFISRRYMII